MILVSSAYNNKSYSISATFRGNYEVFWKSYNKELKNIPLKDTILKSINNESNLLGEGHAKKGYSITGLKDYIIRIYKSCFKNEDLNYEFIKPEKNHLNTIEEVALAIPEKIDIVKRKSGISMGVKDYSERIQVNDFPPLRDVKVTREETLNALTTYEQLKDFPLSSYKKVYLQIKKFCKEKGFQFDIVSPNNILVDTETKQINLIDPVTPELNKKVHGDGVDFTKYHGCDSLYPILCDFLMHKEHLANLTPDEKEKWKNSINIIIEKCITAGKSIGFDRNINQLRKLYEYIDTFWTTNESCKRFDNFINLYSDTINQDQIITDALNYKNSIKERINAIQNLRCSNFKNIKPILEKLLEAPHQPKVEIPEILNATLNKILEYGIKAKTITPSLEKLFDKEIFCTTKSLLYDLFITVEPNNKKFLEEISKSANNIFERNLYKEQFKFLYQQSKNLSNSERVRIKEIYDNSLSGDILPQYIIDKLWISRTCSTSNPAQTVSLNNMVKVYNYIENASNKNHKLTDNLVEIHKIVMANTPKQEMIIGKLRTPDTDYLIKQIFNIKEKKDRVIVNDYSASKDVVSDLDKLDNYIKLNRDKIDPFHLAANMFLEITRIHPFINGNGRTTRLYVEQFLLSKGFRLMKWPEEALYRKIFTSEQLAEYLKQNCIKN